MQKAWSSGGLKVSDRPNTGWKHRSPRAAEEEEEEEEEEDNCMLAVGEETEDEGEDRERRKRGWQHEKRVCWQPAAAQINAPLSFFLPSVHSSASSFLSFQHSFPYTCPHLTHNRGADSFVFCCSGSGSVTAAKSQISESESGFYSLRRLLCFIRRTWEGKRKRVLQKPRS